MTMREIYIVEFLREYKVARTSTLCHFFFVGKWSCYKVLERMIKRGDIKKEKLINGNMNSEDIYYVNRLPSQLRHSLALTDFYSKWDTKYGSESFEIQRKIGDIIPDALMVQNGEIKFVEIELSNKGFNYLKYEEWCISGKYKQFFNKMPEVIIYGKANIPNNTTVNYRVVV